MRGVIARGFTLIELLIVVLIIGILSAVALPQYQRTVERARMAEAIVNLRAIAHAHQLYYLANGNYLGSRDMEKLDITIPGSNVYNGRVATKDFYYSPNGDSGTGTFLAYLTLGWRFKEKDAQVIDIYKVHITQNEPGKIKCAPTAAASDIQQKLCEEPNSKGSL